MRALTSFTLGLATSAALAQAPVVVGGTVPDEASKAAVLERVRALFGAERVIDQLSIGAVTAPPGWQSHVEQLIVPRLKLVSRGQIKVDGSAVSVRGEVGSEAERQQLSDDISASLAPGFSVNNALRVSAGAPQALLDATLDKRIVEFELGKASLTEAGKAILDQMAQALQKLKGKQVAVIGHTDNSGLRASNLALSLARADAVKTYLAGKGIDPTSIAVAGEGPDRPVADNASEQGRARNRRIEFRVR